MIRSHFIHVETWWKYRVLLMARSTAQIADHSHMTGSESSILSIPAQHWRTLGRDWINGLRNTIHQIVLHRLIFASFQSGVCHCLTMWQKQFSLFGQESVGRNATGSSRRTTNTKFCGIIGGSNKWKSEKNGYEGSAWCKHGKTFLSVIIVAYTFKKMPHIFGFSFFISTLSTTF